MTSFYRFASLAFAACLIASLSGCGAPEDRLMKSQIDLLNQMAAALENDASDDTLKAIQKKMESNGEKMNALNLTMEERKALSEKYEPAARAALERMQKAFMAKLADSMPGPGGFSPGGFPGFGPSGGFPGFGN